MRALLQAAAGLIFVVGFAHSYLGERYLLMRLFARGDLPHLFGGPQFTQRTLRFAWHLTTVAWWGLAALLWLAADGALDARAAVSVVGCTALVSSLITLVVSRGQHLAWLAFLAVGAAALYAAPT